MSKAKDRKNEECLGYKNWDTATVIGTAGNTRRTAQFLSQKKNREAIQKMGREDIVRTLKRNGADLRGINMQNVSTRQVKKWLKEKYGD